MESKVTIVSAFVTNVNHVDRTLEAYFNYGKLLLESDLPKIIFVDEPMHKLISDNNIYCDDKTIIIKINKTDSYLYEYINDITNFNINTTNTKKDTLEFMLTMCNKTEWLKEAILLDPFNSQNFIWIDYGLRHVFKCNDETFVSKINSLKDKTYENVRIASIWNLDYKYNIDIEKDIAWYFAGGVFGGNKDSLVLFANKVKEKCIDIITTKKTITWEVNIWYLIYLENKNLFDNYNCDHNDSIIDNY
jgi:hypothetical protein